MEAFYAKLRKIAKTKPDQPKARKGQQMKTRFLAVAAALAISVAVGVSASKAAPAPDPTGNGSAAGNRDLPAEIREFQDRRYECNHAITAERSRQLRCRELLTDEAALKMQYAGNELALRALQRPLLQKLTAGD
jgi:hypothetical protein